MGSKHAYPLLWRETHCFPRLLAKIVSASPYKIGRNVRGLWRNVSQQLPKAWKITSLITGNTGKMLRHLCSVDCECRAASDLAGSHSLRAGGNNQQRKGNSHLSSETILSIKVSQSILLCMRWDFSLWKLFSKLPTYG